MLLYNYFSTNSQSVLNIALTVIVILNDDWLIMRHNSMVKIIFFLIQCGITYSKAVSIVIVTWLKRLLTHSTLLMALLPFLFFILLWNRFCFPFIFVFYTIFHVCTCPCVFIRLWRKKEKAKVPRLKSGYQ